MLSWGPEGSMRRILRTILKLFRGFKGYRKGFFCIQKSFWMAGSNPAFKNPVSGYLCFYGRTILCGSFSGCRNLSLNFLRGVPYLYLGGLLGGSRVGVSLGDPGFRLSWGLEGSLRRVLRTILE
jgi:hypothetical protein